MWSAIALSIAEDRERDSSLFIEDVGQDVAGDTPAERENALHARMEHIVDSVVLCGEDQGVKYKEIFVGFKTEWVPEGYVGCGLTCAPYVVLARNAVPNPASKLLDMSLSQWERQFAMATTSLSGAGPMTSRSVLDRSAFPILVVAGPERERLAGETLRRIRRRAGRRSDHEIVRSNSITDAAALVTSDPSFGCLLLDWNLEHESGKRPAMAVLDQVRRHNVRVPVFLMVEREDLGDDPAFCRGDGAGVRARVRGHAELCRRADRLRLAPPHREPAAPVLQDAGGLHRVARVLLAHARACRRDGVPQVTGRQGLLRLLRRDPVPHRSRRSRSQSSAHCWTTRESWEKPSATPPGSSVPTRPISF